MRPEKPAWVYGLNVSPYLFEIQNEGGQPITVVGPFAPFVHPIRARTEKIIWHVAATATGPSPIPAAQWAVYAEISEWKPGPFSGFSAPMGSAVGGANNSNYGPDNADNEAPAATNTDLLVKQRMYAFDGTNWQRIRTAIALDAGLTLGLLSTHLARILDSAAGTLTSLQDKALAVLRAVSAANTQQQFVIDLRNLASRLAIVSVASGGTATLIVEASSDNVNWITVDSIAAALTQAKDYSAGTVGAATAVSPLAFRFVRITAGAAGVGNTTTLTAGAK